MITSIDRPNSRLIDIQPDTKYCKQHNQSKWLHSQNKETPCALLKQTAKTQSHKRRGENHRWEAAVSFSSKRYSSQLSICQNIPRYSRENSPTYLTTSTRLEQQARTDEIPSVTSQSSVWIINHCVVIMHPKSEKIRT